MFPTLNLLENAFLLAASSEILESNLMIDGSLVTLGTFLFFILSV